jgi:hypothetical protein
MRPNSRIHYTQKTSILLFSAIRPACVCPLPHSVCGPGGDLNDWPDYASFLVLVTAGGQYQNVVRKRGTLYVIDLGELKNAT